MGLPVTRSRTTPSQPEAIGESRSLYLPAEARASNLNSSGRNRDYPAGPEVPVVSQEWRPERLRLLADLESTQAIGESLVGARRPSQ